MPNHLATENSPYLLQHANNPVNWYPWGSEALDKARSEDKPIFLSIGYAACHWCHVMAHESFEDITTAALLNEHFINIKVDREERPELDGIYMQAVVALTGQGGWPMSVFLAPDGTPFYGGTYFPPVRRYNMPAFAEVLLAIARLWHEDRSRLLENSKQIAQYLQQNPSRSNTSAPLETEILNSAVVHLAQSYDWENGGWGKAPKFPQPMAIEFLLRRATQGDSHARDIAAHALMTMARGGMYDVIGGGFSRYSTDDLWRIPHFEKMLYDNAQLSLTYLHGWLVTKETHFRQVCEHTLDFIDREMSHSLGGFYSSIDADSEGIEGKYYLWTQQEIQVVLNDPLDINIFTAAYDLSESGNFEGKNVLQRSLTNEELAEKFGLPVEVISDRLKLLHERLQTARSARLRPATDDKILVAWNALALIAFSEAGRYMGRADYLTVAQRNARFILENLVKNDRLLRSWRAGQARHNAYLEDYAALILGLLSLYQSDSNPEWYSAALKLTDDMITHFTDPEDGFFDTRDDHETLIIRPKDLQDNATPSGNALAAYALLQLAAYEGRSDWRNLAEKMISEIQEAMAQYPLAYAQWLQAADFALGSSYEVALIGDPDDPQTQAFSSILWKSYRPSLVAAISAYPPEPMSPALLSNRLMLNNLPTAYVCQGSVCLQPTNSPEEMAVQLAAPSQI